MLTNNGELLKMLRSQKNIEATKARSLFPDCHDGRTNQQRMARKRRACQLKSV